MNARRDSSDGPEGGSLAGRALLAGAVVFAAAATGLLVLTEEQKWLRLGIVAALWAALAGAFLAARYRRQVTDQREALAERQRIYELELEREIAARREHELEVEAEAKRKAEESSRDDLAALRAELQNMRQTLESLLGGEFLVERYALRAEATRMRSLEEDRSLAMKHLPPAVVKQANVVLPRDGETELIERVGQKPRREPAPQRPEQRVADPRPPSAPRRTPRPERATPEPVKPAAARVEHPAEVSDRWFVPDGLMDPQLPPRPPSRTEQPRRQEPQRPADPPPTRRPTPSWDTGEQEWGPSWEKKDPRRPEPVNGTGPQPGLPYDTGAYPAVASKQSSWLAQYNKPLGPPQRPTQPTGAQPIGPQPTGAQPSGRHPVGPPVTGAHAASPQATGAHAASPQSIGSHSVSAQSIGSHSVSAQSIGSHSVGPQATGSHPVSPQLTGSHSVGPQATGSHPVTPRPAGPQSTGQQPAVQQPAASVSRAYAPPRPHTEPAPPTAPVPLPTTPTPAQQLPTAAIPAQPEEPTPDEDAGGGRRRRAEGQPSWQETVSRRATEEPSGSHASGRSVSELLATHGLDPSPRRRRRRED